jgi:hypothetical protein
LEGLRQAEEAVEGIRREVEEKARDVSFDPMRSSKIHLERGTASGVVTVSVASESRTRRGTTERAPERGEWSSFMIDGMVNRNMSDHTMTF